MFVPAGAEPRPPRRPHSAMTHPEASAGQQPKPRWSALGPQPTGEPRTTAGTSGHHTFVRTAGRSTYGPLTSYGGDRRRGVRVSPPPAASPSGSLPTGGGSPRTGLTVRSSWEPSRPGRRASSFSPAVPPRAANSSAPPELRAGTRYHRSAWISDHQAADDLVRITTVR